MARQAGGPRRRRLLWLAIRCNRAKRAGMPSGAEFARAAVWSEVESAGAAVGSEVESAGAAVGSEVESAGAAVAVGEQAGQRGDGDLGRDPGADVEPDRPV